MMNKRVTLQLLVLFVWLGARAQEDSISKKSPIVHQASVFATLITDYDGTDLSPLYSLHFKFLEASAGVLFAPWPTRHERTNVFGGTVNLTFLPFKKRYPMEPYLRISYWAEKWNETYAYWDTSTLPYDYVIEESRAQVAGVAAAIGIRANVNRLYGELTLPGMGGYNYHYSAKQYSDFAHRGTSLFGLGLGFRIQPKNETLRYGEHY